MDEQELIIDLKATFDKYVNTLNEDNSESTLRVMSDIWFFLEANNAFLDEPSEEIINEIVPDE